MISYLAGCLALANPLLGHRQARACVRSPRRVAIGAATQGIIETIMGDTPFSVRPVLSRL